ncbi:MAG: phosphoesterase [Acidobacteria bacterium]|nr:MAG: phosphoesterase [Acidobacteriota bacterium]
MLKSRSSYALIVVVLAICAALFGGCAERAAIVTAPASASSTPATQAPLTRAPDEAVNDAAVRTRVGLLPSDTLLFNGWGITPAGRHVALSSDMPLKMIVSPDKRRLVIVGGFFRESGLTLLDIETRQVSQFLPLERCWNGIAFSRDGKRLFVSGSDTGTIHIFDYADGRATYTSSSAPIGVVKPGRDVVVYLTGIAVHPQTGRVYVCNEAAHEVWVLHPDTLALEAKVPTGQHPHTCVLGADRQHLYVSNWGSRSVSIIDTAANQRVRDVTVGLRPNDMAMAGDGRLFVACSGDNTVHVITTGTLEPPPQAASPVRRLWEGTREIISTSLYPQSPEGSTPCAVAVSPDDRTLFVANADNNAVMVVDISNRMTEEAKKLGQSISVVDGFIPVGWYPTALAVSPDSGTLFVANGKGLASRPSLPALSKKPMNVKGHPPFDASGKIFDGSVSCIARPDAAQMAQYTMQVRKNSPFTPEALTRAPIPSESIIPEKVGDPCPIKYVLYIIKENRTYDQVLGDLTDAQGRPLGNGKPELTLFGEKVTPNQHQIARDYVLFDNLYSNSEVSVDGHSWCDAAMATDFNQRSWITRYSGHGNVPGNEEMETPANGYLWDLCRRHGVSYRNYGEGAQRVPAASRGRWADSSVVRDMDLVEFWMQDLKDFESTGVMPRFTIMSLGENHTRGTRPGAFTPDACVGSNDLALGKLLAAATRSKFWPEMAIFVIEDDTQNGPDHVDAHRTVGFVISPYVKRGYVDSRFYTTASMLRTMELILGLPPLTQYDAGATPMYNAFQRTPTITQHMVLTPQVDLMAKNPPDAPFGSASARMNFEEYDQAPEDELNRILWYNAKPGVPYPTPIHGALFVK